MFIAVDAHRYFCIFLSSHYYFSLPVLAAEAAGVAAL